MRFGVCYYPEHWREARWASDAASMRALGIEIVRIAEFAWARMEPVEGQYHWDWLDRAIDTLAAAGHGVVLGTPTAAPPAWLSCSYPDTLPVDDQGRRRNFGARRHYCPNAPSYRELTEKIVAAMADRYSRSPAVIGWQIDNEFGGGRTARCYCDHCIKAFRRWLEEKYGSLSALNQAWGTVFWSQTYSAWDQIGAPILTGSAPNPSQVLDYYRFASGSWASYQKLQLDLLQAHADLPRQFVTHNMMGLFFTDIDYFDLAADLDFVSLDSYPTGGIDRIREALYLEELPPEHYAADAGDPVLTNLELDLTRGLKKRPFWIMEQQPGQINWSVYNTGIRPEAVRLWTWQAVAQGVDTVVYFRWRPSIYAQEQYHEGILKHDASPGTGYRALERLQVERQALDELAAAPRHAEVALVFDYEDLWALQIQPHRRGLQYLTHVFRLYRALQALSIPVDIVPRSAEITPYRMIIAPLAHLGDAGFADSLAACARGGGTVLMTIRVGFKTATNVVTDRPLPGVYQELLGVTVDQWHALAPGVQYGFESQVEGLTGAAEIWAEALIPDGAEPLAVYTSGPFAGKAALTERRHGAGRAVHLGWHPTLEQARVLLARLAETCGVTRLADRLDPGLLVYRRGDQTLLLNFSDTPQDAQLRPGEVVTIPPMDLKRIGGH